MNSTLTYRQARLIVLGFGTALISGVSLIAYFRGADLVEVGAVALFLPVLYGLAFGSVPGGLVTGVLAAGAYAVLRFVAPGLPAGLDPSAFIGTGLVRAMLYVGLGLFGGWANAQLAHTVRKLELYDEIDDETGVGNARALLSLADRERSRAERYRSVFSLAVVQVDRGALEGVHHRRVVRALRRFCQTVESSVRATDLVTRVAMPDREDIAVVLPETGREGAELLLGRLVDGARRLLTEDGLSTSNGSVHGFIVTYPDDDTTLASYRQEVAAATGSTP